MDLLKPDYNILSTAGSSLNYKHSEEAKAKMKAWSLSPENIERLKILNANPELQAKRLEWLKILNANP